MSYFPLASIAFNYISIYDTVMKLKTLIMVTLSFSDSQEIRKFMRVTSLSLDYTVHYNTHLDVKN